MNIKHFQYTPSDSDGTYNALFTDSFEGKTLELIKEFVSNYDNIIYIVDKNLPKEYIQQIAKVTEVDIQDNLIELDPSEKTVTRAIQVWDKLVKFVPNAAIVLGGGTIGDLSGFTCGTYQRGIPRLYFPTTVLSVVDASLGGKSGIDHNGVKNSVGVIHYPESVISYTPFLKTLDKAEYNSGYAEIVKAAVLYSEEFFNTLEKYAKNYNKYSYTSPETIDVFTTSSQIKTKICEEPNNAKIRLLYGHSIGHALEKLEDTHRRHGDCVAIGMNIEGAISVLNGYWNINEWKRQKNMIKSLHMPTSLPENINLDELVEKMLLYKKLVSKDAYLFSVPEKIGRVVNQDSGFFISIEKSEMKKALIKAISFDKEN